MKVNLKKFFIQFFSYISKENNQNKLKKINLGLSIGCIFFIASILDEYQNSFSFKSIKFSEIVLLFIAYFTAGYLWSTYMKDSFKGNFIDYFYNWALSNVGKFFPSGVMLITVRLNQNTEEKNSKEIFYGVLEEQFLFPIISIPALGFVIFFEHGNYNMYFFPIYLVVFFYIVKKIYVRTKIRNKSLIDYPTLFLLSLYIQFLTLYHIAYNIGYDDAFRIAAYYLLSSSLGLFFVGVPAGFGIREAIFFTITNSFMGNVLLLEYMVKVRVIYLLADIFFGVLGFINIYLKK